ncbi:hypothetical protein SAMN05421736_106122 [Evansella caseinilytica]|uniref:Uncharacterized protein n=1 Tax=Evansella caseinilytica TaxID=1503961 RepID=A0A1H3QCI3_9BACI|nr:hypothetical protein SAMN05421736_106122 [Evansella caseinilytica]
MKYIYWAISGIINYVLGIAFVVPSGFMYISVLYALEEVFGWVIDPTLEPNFLVGALVFTFMTSLIYFPILILTNVFLYKRLLTKKYKYYLFIIFFLGFGFVSFIYYKVHIF